MFLLCWLWWCFLNCYMHGAQFWSTPAVFPFTKDWFLISRKQEPCLAYCGWLMISIGWWYHNPNSISGVKVPNFSTKILSKVHQRSLNLFRCVIPVLKLAKWPFRYLNLFGCVILVPKLKNLPYRSSNLFSCVIPVPKLVFKSYLGQNRTNLKTLYWKIIYNFFIWTQMKINFISKL